MRNKTNFIFVIIFIMATGVVWAESPREQINQMVEQLQKTPTDDALREKIIKLAQELKPAPAVPEEAERRMARGTAAIKGAKSVADYRDAAKEFEQATLVAPWHGDAYFNLGFVQDKAENYEAALRSLKLALLASPNDKEIKALIYEVEYRSEKARSPETAAAREREKDEELIKSLDGTVYVEHIRIENGFEYDSFYEVRGNTLFCRHRTTAIYNERTAVALGEPTRVGDEKLCGSWRWESGRFIYEDSRLRATYMPLMKGQMLRIGYLNKLDASAIETYRDIQRH